MKLTTLAMIGAVSVAVMGTASATPLAPDVVAQATSDIVQVRGGCGPGWMPTRRGCVPDPRWRGPRWRGPHWRSRRWKAW